jgi:predicted TIM-barrel fold metal-dependent hydrolase
LTLISPERGGLTTQAYPSAGNHRPSAVDATTWGYRFEAVQEKTFRDIFCEHFWITTSGFFSDTALMCSMMEMGIDRILFSVDYPFAENLPGTEWLKTLPLGPEDTDKLLNGNARRLLKI